MFFKDNDSKEGHGLIYCGFNVYATSDGHVFEKQADFTMLESDCEEVRAEQRFIHKHRLKD